MRTVQLGTTGIAVSEFFFGAGGIGGIGTASQTIGLGLSEDAGVDMLQTAYENGIRVIDTADSYAAGASERAIGRWLRERTPDAIIETKVGRTRDGRNDLSADYISRQLAQSIERIGRVDLYLNHFTDPHTRIEETLTAFAAAREAGQIRAYGCSNVTVDDVVALLSSADRLGIPRPGWIQNEYNLLTRHDDVELLPLLKSEGIGYTPYSPLAAGLLTGRYLDGSRPEHGSRLSTSRRTVNRYLVPSYLQKLQSLSSLAEQRGISTAALALAWLRHNDSVTASIVSPSKPSHWASVTEALAFDWDETIETSIEELFPPTQPKSSAV